MSDGQVGRYTHSMAPIQAFAPPPPSVSASHPQRQLVIFEGGRAGAGRAVGIFLGLWLSGARFVVDVFVEVRLALGAFEGEWNCSFFVI